MGNMLHRKAIKATLHPFRLPLGNVSLCPAGGNRLSLETRCEKLRNTPYLKANLQVKIVTCKLSISAEFETAIGPIEINISQSARSESTLDWKKEAGQNAFLHFPDL